MIAITARCGACSVFYRAATVGASFRVRVEDDGRPVKSLRVVIGSDQGGGNRAVADTDKDGLALFRSVRPGSYHLSADHDAGVGDGADLDVKPDGPTDVTVPLRWPNMGSVFVRSLKGTIRGPDYLPGQSQPRLSLDLLEASSGRKLKSLRTTESGEFNFGSAAQGLYFLSLKPSGLTDWGGEQITGLVAVAVDQGSPTDHLDVDLAWSSCGLAYVDRSKCPKGDLQIEQLSGQVLDASGAVIADAKILLFDTAGTLVERLSSDGMGKFTSPHTLVGTYQLVVSTAGFTPLRTTVHAEPTGDSARLSPLTVQLGVGGSCSSANLQ
jgi:hypothetical protein